MKNLFFFFLAIGLFSFAACNDDDGDTTADPDYHIHFHTPAEDGTTTSMQGQTLIIEIEFEDHNAGPVHHVNVKVYKKDDATVVLYDGPSDAHVHETSGKYTFTHDLLMDPATVGGHTDWIVEAKVWGHDAGVAEVTASAQFHVHPM